jgi:putative spermidine/putrescine transport system permease protein
VSTIDPQTPTGAAGADRSRRRLRSSLRKAAAGRLAVLPLLLFVAVAFGLPAVAMAFGSFTTYAPGHPTHYTMGNLTASLQGGYLTALLGSVKLSAIAALISTVFGLLLAQAVVTSRFEVLRHAVLSASGVLANFGGVPLAFAFIAILGNAGLLTEHLHLADAGWNLYGLTGLGLVYLYFLIPLMVLTVLPALDGLRKQWREAAQNNGANLWQYWRYVALPVLAPSLLGGFVLLFGSAFAAYATAAAMVGAGGAVPLITLQIAASLNGNVDANATNVALAMSLDMVVISVLIMALYLPLQRRSARWLV